MNEIFIFLDTNIFLHYQPIEQIDWQKIFSSKKINLIIAPIVIRELDRHKDQHRILKIRNRARSALKKIRSAAVSGNVTDMQDGIIVRVEREPEINFIEFGLHRDIPDDQLIASCLDFKNKEGTDSVFLVAHDTGPIIKAIQNGIQTQELPDIYNLPSAVDDVEKELGQLRKEVVDLKYRQPKLDLLFSNKSKVLKVNLSTPVNVTDEEIDQEILKLKIRYPAKHPDDNDTANNISSFSTILSQQKKEEFDRYNGELEDYFKKYEKYLRLKERSENLLIRSLKIELVLINDGNTPAEDIDVFMHFPDGFNLVDARNKPTMPKEPSPPHPPRTMGEMIRLNIPNLNIGHYSPTKTILPSNLTSGLNIKKSNSYDVDFSLDRLKQNLNYKVAPMFLVFQDYDSASSFSIDFRINAGNLPEDVTGSLNVVVTK